MIRHLLALHASRYNPGVTNVGIERTLRWACLVAGLLPWLLPASTTAQSPPETKRIYVVAPLRWDPEMNTERQGPPQASLDFANLTGGLQFGMTPTDVNARLPEPAYGISWSALPMATEFPDDARYFWVKLEGGRELRAGIEHCLGANSYVAFIFRPKGLFRISYRLFPDAACPDVSGAAGDIFGRYTRLARTIALATHYRSGRADVVDLNDPTANYLIPIRWQNRDR